MKAITLWQPWASLLAIMAKLYETRSWATNYRGPIAIHAAARKCDYREFPMHAHYPMMQALVEYTRQYANTTGWNILDVLPRGAIVATAELVGCWKISACTSTYGPGYGYVSIGANGGLIISPNSNEFLFGDWTPGRYAWEFANMVLLPEPIPAKGGQRLWNWEGAA